MKTPRQILFDRHHSAESKLNEVRQRALASLAADPTQHAAEKVSSGPMVSLRALLLSLRWHLAGMAAVWLAVALLNMDPSSPPPSARAERSNPSPRQLLAALRENRRQLLELIEPPDVESSSARPPSRPPRRSEIQSSIALA